MGGHLNLMGGGDLHYVGMQLDNRLKPSWYLNITNVL